ncbi:MAG TPA: site-specific DNA-methyltransferase, partial [Chloroflexota bacterium]|nr:site-specific DNA-methyltransferase [Chloroflexota bacterium]
METPNETDSNTPARDYRYARSKRKNNPPAGLAAQGRIAERPREKYSYNPHLPPALRFDPSGSPDRLPDLLTEARRRPLTADEVGLLAEALRTQEPWLEWTGKREKHELEVDAQPLHIHERVSTKAILAIAARQEVQRSFFADPQQEYREAVKFYQYDVDWSNRLILGDSLVVMSSLARREDLAGKVQMIYLDPPYGIRFASNFQPQVGQRNVADKPADLTREPEVVKAYRDTWTLGIHSYLTYLRDRLLVARELLADTGSIFVQIGDENLHLVRCLLDEVFGRDNFAGLISYATTGGFATSKLSRTGDYLLWYGKDIERIKYQPLFVGKSSATLRSGDYRLLELKDGSVRPMSEEEREGSVPPTDGARVFRLDNLTSQGAASNLQPVQLDGTTYNPPSGSHWKAHWPDGVSRLSQAERLFGREGSIAYRRYLDDFPVIELTSTWVDTSVAGRREGKLYAVQTNEKVIERCLLMTTDPGDLVLDPTCGSGTTAYIAEQWGRRWITIDTSRVAIALARQRLLAARLSQYLLADPETTDIRRGFKYETVAHVTLKSIANNPDIYEDSTAASISAAIKANSDREILYDRPQIDPAVVRVPGPFTVESLSPYIGSGRERLRPDDPESDGTDYTSAIIDNLRAAGVQNTVRNERLTFDRLEPWPGKYVHAVGEYSEDGNPRRAAVTIGPQYGTVDADIVRDAAKEAAGFFDILIVCGFAFDAYIANEFKQLGNLAILKANMNPDLSMGGDLLKKTGSGNLFTVFGEPDIDVRGEDGRVVVEIRGLDVYDPTTGQVRSHTT